LATRPEEDEGGHAPVVRVRRGGAGLVGLQLGLVAGQGRVGVVAGPADMGRAEVADFLRSTHSCREGSFLEIRFRSRDTCSIGGAGVLGRQAS
jgi:hypothetical protein